MKEIKKQNNPIYQHYVPQVYLKNFCSQDGLLSVLDKDTGKIFSTGTSVVGGEKNFYTLDKMKDPYCWEKAYAEGIEPMMGEIFPKIISQDNVLIQNGKCIINAKEKVKLAIIIIMQLFRGKQSRQYEEKLFRELLPATVERAKAVFSPLTDQQEALIKEIESKDYYFKRISMDVTLDIERIKQYTDILCRRKFIICHICGDLEFVTSDNPTMFINSRTANATPFSNGLFHESTLVYYPVSPKLILCAIHPNALFQVLSDKDGCLFQLNSDMEKGFISTINRKQKEQCYRQVYARTTDTLKKL